MDRLHYDVEVDATSIRLLDIALQDNPDDPNNVIPSVTVSHHSLDKLPVYYALSYTWAPPSYDEPQYAESDKIPILLHNEPLNVIPNLYDALLQCRQSYPDIPFWIDAICIDQHHRAEREAQVGIMDKIYRNATKVIVWLGKEQPATRRGVELLNIFAKVAGHEVPRILRDQQFGVVSIASKPEAAQDFGLPRLDLDDSKALVNLYSSRWFHRIWILQEIALARDGRVHWGDISTSWDDLGMVATFIQITALAAGLTFLFARGPFNMRDVDGLGQGFLVAMRIQLIREWCRVKASPLRDALMMIDVSPGLYGTDMNHTLLRLLQWTTVSFKASETRDCVYGFIGILNHLCGDEPLPKHLQPDYLRPLPQIMLEITKKLMESTQSLHVLGLVCDPGLHYDPENPSWVPYLAPEAAASIILGPTFKSMVENDLLFHASTKKPESGTCIGRFSIEDKRLCIHGQRVGVIDRIGEELDDALQGQFSGWADIMLAMDPVYPSTGQSRGNAFRRTLVMDTDGSQRPASGVLLDGLQEFFA